MKTLHLNLKRKWFDMIKSGEKWEEYREIKPFWVKRFNNIKCSSEPTKTVTFSNGYHKDRDQFVIELNAIFIRHGRLDWGAPTGKSCFVLVLGEILGTECGICRENKKSTKWFGSWENYVCAECDQAMDEGYKECYPDD